MYGFNPQKPCFIFGIFIKSLVALIFGKKKKSLISEYSSLKIHNWTLVVHLTILGGIP